jgi:hypothetical protein
VFAFSFGKAKTGGSGYPTISCLCTYNGTNGIFRSDDHGVTWNQIPAPPTFLPYYAIGSDYNTYGIEYITPNGSGWMKRVN